MEYLFENKSMNYSYLSNNLNSSRNFNNNHRSNSKICTSIHISFYRKYMIRLNYKPDPQIIYKIYLIFQCLSLTDSMRNNSKSRKSYNTEFLMTNKSKPPTSTITVIYITQETKTLIFLMESPFEKTLI